MTYTNVVRGWVKLGEWNGQPRKFSKPLAEINAAGEVDSFAVVVQGGKPDTPGNVYGAAMASLDCSAPLRTQNISNATDLHEKKGRHEAGLKKLGIEPYAVRIDPIRSSPGGWGAEESGTLRDRVLRPCIAMFRGECGTEFGPYCGSVHEAVTASQRRDERVAHDRSFCDPPQCVCSSVRVSLADAAGNGNHKAVMH